MRSMAAGRAYGIRPAGMLALDVVRLEAGLVLLEVDYTSARHALNPEQNYSPFEIGMGKLVALDKALGLRRPPGTPARAGTGRPGAPARRRPARLERHRAVLLGARPAAGDLRLDRPVRRARSSPRAATARSASSTSHGWSPILKQAIGLASVSPAYEAVGSKLAVEWTVEGHRGRVDATVVPMPFLDLPRKRA